MPFWHGFGCSAEISISCARNMYLLPDGLPMACPTEFVRASILCDTKAGEGCRRNDHALAGDAQPDCGQAEY